jgi:hypothetical protein
MASTIGRSTGVVPLQFHVAPRLGRWRPCSQLPGRSPTRRFRLAP